MTPSEIKRILSGLGIRPDKRHGQHFLTDDRLLRRQADYAEISDSSTVLEIGPGLGALTERLLEMAGKVVAVEYDRKLCEYLECRFEPEIADKKLSIIPGDALEATLPKFDKVVANLPYNISSEFTFTSSISTSMAWIRMIFLKR